MHSFSSVWAVVLPAALFYTNAHAFCYAEAGRLYGVPAPLLMAISKVESGFDPAAINRSHRSRTGSIDLGLMQINSRWVQRPPLSQLGYSPTALLDPCTNVKVGAWVLSDLFRRYGSTGDGLWSAVGAYNAACTSLHGLDCVRARRVYAWKVYRALRSLERLSS
jgi:soluble lytic murein transglycosylase-like protein